MTNKKSSFRSIADSSGILANRRQHRYDQCAGAIVAAKAKGVAMGSARRS